MRFLHTMIRVRDLDATLEFFTHLGLHETRRREVPEGKFTLVFLSTPAEDDTTEIELIYNWDQEEAYGGGRNFGHVAFAVEDIYKTCAHLQESGIPILRPPRDGRMAFIRSPDEISVELLQAGAALPVEEPWASMQNQGEW